MWPVREILMAIQPELPDVAVKPRRSRRTGRAEVPCRGFIVRTACLTLPDRAPRVRALSHRQIDP